MGIIFNKMSFVTLTTPVAVAPAMMPVMGSIIAPTPMTVVAPAALTQMHGDVHCHTEQVQTDTVELLLPEGARDGQVVRFMTLDGHEEIVEVEGNHLPGSIMIVEITQKSAADELRHC